MSKDPRRNASGYIDLTAYYAIKAADKKNKAKHGKHRRNSINKNIRSRAK